MFKVLWSEYSSPNVSVYLVDGAEQTKIYQDFNQGGNWMAYDGKRVDYKLTPGEIYIELFDYVVRMKRWLIHESTETYEMLLVYQKLDHDPTIEERDQIYNDCHDKADAIEAEALDNPDKTDELLNTAITNLSELMAKQIPILEESMNTAELKEAVMKAIQKTLSVTVEASDDTKRTITFDASNETKDRDGEVIKASAWDLANYLKNPVVQWAHDYTAPPVGKSPGINVSNGVLKLPVEFPPEGTYEFADIIYNLAKKGFISAVSVGFIPKSFTKGTKEGDPSRTYTSVELLEVSIVPVPSNPDAIVSARNAGVITAKQFDMLNPIKDAIATAPIVEITRAEVLSKPHTASQEEIKDELDYVIELIKLDNFNDANKSLLKTMHSELTKRFPGNDIPVSNKAYGDIISALDEHHKSHNKCYKDCKDALSQIMSACNDMKAVPEVNIAETITETIKLWRTNNGTN